MQSLLQRAAQPCVPAAMHALAGQGSPGLMAGLSGPSSAAQAAAPPPAQQLPRMRPASGQRLWPRSAGAVSSAIAAPRTSSSESFPLQPPAGHHAPQPLRPGEPWRQQHAWLGQRRAVVICGASKGGGEGKDGGAQGSGKKGGAGDANKADFSAYWSLKVRNFFSARRQYLEGAEQQKVERRPEILDRLDAEIAKQAEEIDKARADEPPPPTVEELAQARVELEAEANARAAKMLEPLQQRLLGRTLPELAAPPPASAVMLEEVRMTLVPSWTDWISLGLLRAKQLLQAVLMSPWSLLVAAHSAWQRLFTSQRYEMFLMSEGERIWYWRNRMENERWFWEAFAWDRLIFPILVAVAYQYITPANLIWTVVVPAVFIVWQTGRLPGPNTLDFWLIAYFGVYRKCWPDVVAAARLLFSWS